MKIIVAIDSFKDSLTSLEAGAEVRKGILSVFQSTHGKIPSSVAKLAKKINPNIITIGLGGSVDDISDDTGLDAAFSILRSPMTLKDAMKKEIAKKNISETAAQIFKLIKKISCVKVGSK